MNKDLIGLENNFLEILLNHNFPGNIRELENIIKSAVTIEKGKYLTIRSLPDYIKGKKIQTKSKFEIKNFNLKEARIEIVGDFEKQFLMKILTETKGNVTKAARLTNLERQSFQRLLRKYKIFSVDFKQ